MTAVATSSDEVLKGWEAIEWFKEEKKGKNGSNQVCAQVSSEPFIVFEGKFCVLGYVAGSRSLGTHYVPTEQCPSCLEFSQLVHTETCLRMVLCINALLHG